MIVIAKDNHDRDHISERVHKTGLSQEEAEYEAGIMNCNSGPHSNWYYVVKPDDYVPFKWEP